MSNIQTLIFILVLVFAVVFFIFAVFPYLKKRGINLDAVLAQTQKAIDTANSTMELIKPFLADVNGVDVVEKIISSAKTGAAKAEQLHKVGELKGDERNASAKAFVYDALKLAGVSTTPEIERLVDGAVEAGVNGLGHQLPLAELLVGEYEAGEPPNGIPAPEEIT